MVDITRRKLLIGSAAVAAAAALPAIVPVRMHSPVIQSFGLNYRHVRQALDLAGPYLQDWLEDLGLEAKGLTLCESDYGWWTGVGCEAMRLDGTPWEGPGGPLWRHAVRIPQTLFDESFSPGAPLPAWPSWLEPTFALRGPVSTRPIQLSPISSTTRSPTCSTRMPGLVGRETSPATT